MTRRNWTREETLAAFNLYCRTPFGRLHARNPDIIEVADALGRTPGALAMKCCNLAAFDEVLQARGISGLSKASRTDREVWGDFHADPETIAFEAEQAYAAIMRQDPRMSEAVEWEDVAGLDRHAVRRVRVNQHFFRSIILTGYLSKCAVCSLPFPALLVAAHIVPWSVDKSLRMNPRNGICLCSLHDRAFDKGLLIIDDTYRITVNSAVEEESSVESVRAMFMRYAGRALSLPERWHPDPSLLKRHCEMFSAQGVE